MVVMVVIMMMVVLNLDMAVWNWLEPRAGVNIDSRFGHWLIVESCWLGKSIVSSRAHVVVVATAIGTAITAAI